MNISRYPQMLFSGKEDSSLQTQNWVKPLLAATESDEVLEDRTPWADGLQVLLGLGILTTYG